MTIPIVQTAAPKTQAEFLKECKKLANEKSILDVFEASLREDGFSGSADISKLTLLALYTRMKDPVSLSIKGTSGSGKSYSLAAALRHVPKTAYEQFSGMSEKALLYAGLDLKNRFLIIQEAAGLSEGVGRVFLRQLLTEGEVRYVTVQSTSAGLVGKELPPVEGPTGLIMTTTANRGHLEDESRLISVQMDESPERIKEALRSQLTSRIQKAERDFSEWHSLHDFVCSGSFSVSIPFGESLLERLPTSHQRVMRDFPKLLSLISAHALMHQCSRESQNGAVIATIDDYAAVFDLVSKPFSEGLEAAVPERIRQIVDAVSKEIDEQAASGVTNGFVPGVSQRRIAKRLGRDPGVISRNVDQAIHQGYLANSTMGQGRQSTLTLGERELPSGTILPTPETLATSLGKREVTEIEESETAECLTDRHIYGGWQEVFARN